MSTEIQTPFGLDSSGSIAVTKDPNVQVSQHVETLVSTQPGERVMIPTYGVPTLGQLYAPNSDVADATLINDVNAAMGTWEPNVNVVDVKSVAIPGEPYGFAGIEVDWSPVAVQTPSSTGLVTATILVGGLVVEDSVT